MRFAIATVAIGGFAAAYASYACDGFTEGSDPPTGDAGSTDGPITDGPIATDGSADDGGNADAGLDASVVGTNCPRPRGPACLPLATCQRVPIYAPAADGIEFPWAIASDSKSVFFATMVAEDGGDDPYNGSGTSKIVRIPSVGSDAGAAPAVLVTGQRRTVALAVAGDYVYWTALVGSESELRRVRRDCSAPCAAETVVSLGNGHVQQLIAVDANTLAARNEGENVKVISIGPMLVSPPNVANAGTYGAIAATNTEVFVSGGLSPDVQRVVVGAGTTTIGTFPDAGDSGLTPGMSPLTTDCRSLYGSRGKGEIWQMSVGGGAPSLLGGTAPDVPIFSVAADETFVYAGAANGFGIYAVAIDGGASTFIQAGNIHRVAVDDDAVYWGDHQKGTGGAIWALKK